MYKTRYQARKAMVGDQAIVKVDAGGGQVGYRLVDWASYHVWRKQK